MPWKAIRIISKAIYFWVSFESEYNPSSTNRKIRIQLNRDRITLPHSPVPLFCLSKINQILIKKTLDQTRAIKSLVDWNVRPICNKNKILQREIHLPFIENQPSITKWRIPTKPNNKRKKERGSSVVLDKHREYKKNKIKNKRLGNLKRIIRERLH